MSKHYRRQFICMCMLILLMMLNSYLLTTLKDSLIVTYYGVDTLSSIRTYIMLPTSFVFLLLYVKIVNIFNARTIFHSTVLLFIMSFCFLSFVVFSKITDLSSKKIVSIIFYIISELWTISMIGVLFWQFANSIYSKQEAKKQYWSFQLAGNIGVIIAGLLVYYLNNLVNKNWLNILQHSIEYFSIFAIIIMILYEIIQKEIVTEKRQELFQIFKIPFRESFKVMSKSHIIKGLFILIVSYGSVEILTEITWKYYVHLFFPMASEYCGFMGIYTSFLGIITTTMILFNGLIFRKFNFERNAWYLPKTVLWCSIVIFLLIVLYILKHNELILKSIVWFGLLQSILFKAVKYAFFDPTKEAIYISLPSEYRTKGKALVDALGNRLGKAIGGLSQCLIFFVLGTTDTATILLLIIVVLFIQNWLKATKKMLNDNKNKNEKKLNIRGYNEDK